MDQVEEVKRKTDIVGLISEYTELKKAGRNYKGLCPFHSEKTPSFIVTPELQIYKCFGCGQGGDAYRFLQELEKIDFPQALKILADRAGVKLVTRNLAGFQDKEEILNLNLLASEFYHFLLTSHEIGKNALAYLTARGINDEAIKAFKLGFSPDNPQAIFDYLTKKRNYKPQLLEKAGITVSSQGKYFDRFRGRIIFPLKDHFGNVLGFAGRVLTARGDLAKYINSPETLVYKKSLTLYGLDLAKNEIKKEGRVIVVEGEFDCISCWEKGIKNTVAIKGSALTQEQAQILGRFTQNVVLALDSDFAGNSAAIRGLEIMEEQGLSVKVLNLGEFKDPDEAAQKDPEGLKKAVTQAVGVYDFLINLSFERNDSLTTEGKAKISRELTPLLAKIDDDIVRAHCIKQVAQRLNVSEDAVASQIQKSTQKNITPQIEPTVETQRTRRDVLEERILSLTLQNKPELLEKHINIFKNQIKVRLAQEIIKVSKEKGSFDLRQIFDDLPPELKDMFSQIALKPQEENLDFDSEFLSLLHELEMFAITEEREQLINKLRIFEGKNDYEQVKLLEKELDQLNSKSSSLEV